MKILEKKLSILLFLFFNLILFEIFSFVFFSINDERLKFNLYKKKYLGNSNYFFSKEVGLVFSKPDNEVVHFTSEFVDIFKTKNILKNSLNLGFFDNGIDLDKKSIVAIGDSFTRGTGSEDNIKYGWVSLIEKKIKNYNVINFGNRGSGINQQFYAYKKLENLIPHEIILYNFFSGNDYFDNLDDLDFNFYLSKKTNSLSEDEIDTIVNKLQNHHGFTYHMDYWHKNDFKLYSIYFLLKVYDYLLNNKVAPRFLINKKNDIFLKTNIKEQNARIGLVSDYLFKLKKEIESKKKVKCNQKYCFRYYDDFQNNKNIQEKIINNSAKKINEFYLYAKKNNKKFFLIVHPWARNLDIEIGYQYNRIDEILLSKINKNIDYLVISNSLKNYEKSNPSKKLFHKYDGHYTKNGYREVSEIIYKYMYNFLK